MTESPRSWRAAVLRETGENLDIIEIARPTLVSGQVLVALEYRGVCRSQLMEVRGHRGPDLWLPHLLGHEGVGEVVEIGQDVTKVAVGDKVVLGWITGEGCASAPPVLSTVDGRYVNAGRVATFSEYSVVSENRVYRKPEEIDSRVAVLFGCALLTGGGIVLNEAQPIPGESVLINGLGGVGLAALAMTQALGIAAVVADPDPGKRKLAVDLGADLSLDPLEASLCEQIRRHFPDGVDVDVAIDAFGATEGIEAAFECLRFGRWTTGLLIGVISGWLVMTNPYGLLLAAAMWGAVCVAVLVLLRDERWKRLLIDASMIGVGFLVSAGAFLLAWLPSLRPSFR